MVSFPRNIKQLTHEETNAYIIEQYYQGAYLKDGKLHLQELKSPLNPEGISHGECAITSLAISKGGKVYGATSGKRCHLFVLESNKKFIYDLGIIDTATRIYHSVSVDKEGKVYIGTMENSGVDDYRGGHLFIYDPDKEIRDKTDNIISPGKLINLGIPVEGEDIYSLVYDNSHNLIYGITYPNGVLFNYSPVSKKIRIIGYTIETLHLMPHDVIKIRGVSRAIICDKEGNVYGSTGDSDIFKYDIRDDKIRVLDVKMPGEKGREYLVVADAFTMDKNGLIYGGTSDGFLFSFDSKIERIKSIGKPLRHYRIRGLAVGNNGMVYGIGGDDAELAHLFVYNPEEHELIDLGMPYVLRCESEGWAGCTFECMVSDGDNVYAGESERISYLFIYNL